MLCDEANVQKQKKRQEQIKKWREMDLIESQKSTSSTSMSSSSRVRFPKSCVFLASCASGDLDEVKQHLKLGVNINTTNVDGLTALHQACIDSNIEMVKFLVENGADLNAQDNEGWTPLHASVSVGNLEVSRFLLSKNARLNVCNNDSDLPIDLCDSSNTQMKAYLEDEMRQQGIDADLERQKEELLMYEDAKDLNFFDKIHHKTGATPLHVSAAKGYTRVMRVLLQGGANVNAVDNDGWTPLHAAAHWEEEEACKILGEYGASFEAKTYSGQTPFDVCDADMANKLRAIQQKYKSASSENRQANEDENKNPETKTDSRARKSSDEFAKSSILRLTNKAKSNLSDREKKQEKIVLTPIIASKQPAALSEPKTPSLDLDEEKEIKKPAVPEKTFDRKLLLNDEIPTSASVEKSNGVKASEAKTNQINEEPTSEKSSATSLDKPTLLSSQDSRRYSCAPVASKDEQAELIRKQKAKLERHFRRSTQAVSYEDIKSAEATIKGSSQPRTPTSPTSLNASNSTYSSDIGGSPTTNNNSDHSSSLQTASSSSSAFAESNHPTTNGQVNLSSSSKLDSLISPLSSASSSNGGHATTSSTTRPLVTSLQSSRVSSTTPNTVSSSTSSLFPSASSFSNLPSTTAPSTQQSANESTEKDNIIANDIETDKLLNEIEKSKGFSDTYSTTRRLRSRHHQNPYGMASFTLNENGDDDQFTTHSRAARNGASNLKKINRLIWNEDRQELEVLDKSLQQHDSSKSPFSDLSTSSTGASKATSSPIVLRKQTSLTDFVDEKKDYQLAYENLRRDNEKLNQTVASLRKEIEEQAKRTSAQMNESSSWDKKERKAFDKRISELEEEIKKMETIRQDNLRLKEENAALIRVISKLSK